jgi:SAM-dependent methyltransferase
VNNETAVALIRMNHSFYQTFADSFSATRQRIQPGVRRIVAGLSQQIDLLDLGCGNGGLAEFLSRYSFRGRYLGVDFSVGLLQNASQINPSSPSAADLQIEFIRADLSEDGWENWLPRRRYSQIFAFSFFHHLPGEELRLAFLKKVHALLEPEGNFALSNWQFLNSPRFRDRILPWDAAGLDAADLDEGDYLLDWRAGPGKRGIRYVHQYPSAELCSLASQTGFTVQEEFYSDGKEGNLGLYQVWQPNGSYPPEPG